MNFARKVYESRFQFTGTRSRMPLYPWIQALFYAPELTEEQFFEQGKKLNIIISVVCLAVLGIAFFVRFPRLYASYAMLVIAYLLFALKAPWLQAELLSYTLIALAFILSIESMRRPKWFMSVAVGALFATAHFAKSTALLGLAVYAGSFIIVLVGRLFDRNRSLRELFRVLAYALTPIAVFFVLLYPYFRESKEHYGQYLYNVNTTFYMWYDSWDEARKGVRGAGARDHWPDVPDAEIPSIEKYVAEHSLDEMKHRLWRGFRRYVDNTCTRLSSPYLLGNCTHIGVGLLVLIASSSLGILRGRKRFTLLDVQVSCFVSAFLSLYVIASFWFWPINNGPRIIYAMVIPLFWTIGLVGTPTRILLPDLVLLGHKFKPMQIVYLLMTIVALYQVYELAAFRAATLFGGN